MLLKGGELPPGLRAYLRSRVLEVALPGTRAASEPLAEWAQRYIRLDGKPFSFGGHAYLRALYDDTSPHVVLIKAAQVGGTTCAILKAIQACRNGLNCIYYFPTKTDAQDLSKSRVSPLLEENPFLARLMSSTDTVGLKRIGSAFLYFRGMQSEVGLKSVPADLLVFDELDEVAPDARARALERLAHSDFKRVIELSNPSLPGYGIDESYDKSDQRHWTVRCDACNTWTALDCAFPSRLGEEVRIIQERKDGTCFLACPRCGSELDAERGEWVAAYPSRRIHGYRISQLFSSKVDPAEILHEYKHSNFPARFFNLKIGIAWADVESKLDVMTVLSQCGESPMLERSEKPCILGIDTGKLLHAVVLREDPEDWNKHHLVHLAICRDFSELDGLMEKFHVEKCVIDALPETHSTRAFAERHAGKVFMCIFNDNQSGPPTWDAQTHGVRMNRTEALDASRAAVRKKLLILPRQDPRVKEFAEQMTQDARVLVEDKVTGEQRYKYAKIGVNHFSLAFTYAWMAASDLSGAVGWLRFMDRELDLMRRQGLIP